MPLKLPKYKYIFAGVDFLIIFATFIFTEYFIGFIHSVEPTLSIFEPVKLSILFTYSLVFIFIFQSNNLYKINVFLTRALHLTEIIRSLFYGGILIIVTAFLFKIPYFLDSRLFIILFLCFALIFLFLTRLVLLRIIYSKLSRDKILNRKVIIIGAGRAGKLLAAKLLVENEYGMRLLGFVDDNKEQGSEILEGKSILGKVKELPSILKKYSIDELIVAIDNVTYDRLLEILDLARNTGVLVKLSSELFEVIPQKINTEKYSGIPVINVSPQIISQISIILKRIFDLTGATIGLLLFSPFFIIVAVLIKLSSEGPVFYTQERIGKDGKPFKFIKFRSMKKSADDDEERKKMMIKFMKEGKIPDEKNGTKIINESRVTWIGKIIRRTSIDELPQLINVLKGEMSLVGPRPCLPYEYENYDDWQKRRVSVLPGCTGVWQVFGRSEVSFKDSIVLDLYYINNMSPWLDLQLIIKTVPVMLFSKGGA